VRKVAAEERTDLLQSTITICRLFCLSAERDSSQR